MFDRFSLLHQSRRLFLLFTAILMINLIGFFLPIFLFVGDVGLSAVSFVDLSYFWLFVILYVVIFVSGSRHYLAGNKPRSKYWFDVMLIVLISQLIGIFYRYWNLVTFFNNNPFDTVTVVFGPYVILLAALIVISIYIRYNYKGIERRNSVFYY
jgi:hypothetical protein